MTWINTKVWSYLIMLLQQEDMEEEDEEEEDEDEDSEDTDSEVGTW